MHEFSIVDSLLGQVRATLAENGLTGVARVEVEAGELRQVIPGVLQFAFAQSVAGTELEGAELVLTVTEARAACRRCGQIYRPQLNDFRCPGCGQADAEISQGDHILLTSITAHQQARKESPL